MKTNKIDAILISMLSTAALISGCGDEQKEATQQKQAEQVTAESVPATPVKEMADKTVETVDKTIEEAGKMEESDVERSVEAMESAAEQVSEKTTEAVHDLVDSAEKETTQAIATVEKAVSDALDVVKTTPAQVRKIQQALLDAGFNPGPVDGAIGPKTMAALESFQKQKGLATGEITKETLRALGVPE
ncbi:MAG: peptidoglycan-binding protein [Gammaproteobacteria bacterium]